MAEPIAVRSTQFGAGGNRCCDGSDDAALPAYPSLKPSPGKESGTGMPSVSTTSTTLRQEQRQATRASLALLLATLAWGCSFTWAKAAGEGINEAAGLPPGSLLGPLVLLAWRFTLAGLLWLCLFPASWRGWTWRSLGHSGLLGGLL